ncbi:hypothetical protein TrST_g8401 [Triparma strigata]|uniref:Bidirectional sugar transporter SWEET n=1 Tax=Triparma strigata TaxID=1606541 RepID=A0A9W7EUU2_9STRA|nr:hypothetical protein TrST_g8401 [Triparma strigata]
MLAPVAPFVQFCGNCAPITSILLYAAPFPTLMSIGAANHPQSLGSDGKQRSSILSLPLLPYSSMTVNATLWTLYGLLISSKPIYLCNSVGILMGLFYVATFVHKSGGLASSSSSKYLPVTSSALPKPLTILSRTDLPSTFSSQITVSLLLLTSGLLAFRLHNKTLIGVLANLICGVMFLSPLSSLFSIIKKKSCPRGSIPLPFTLVQGLNCFLWTVYGKIGLKDVTVWGPNFFGLWCALAQAAVKFRYEGREPGLGKP